VYTKGATQKGSAPTKDGQEGYVYKLGLKNGKTPVEESDPIYTPEIFKEDGDVYEGGLPGLVAWATILGFVILGGAFAIYQTSNL